MKEGVFVQVWNASVPWKSILEQEVLDTRESIQVRSLIMPLQLPVYPILV